MELIWSLFPFVFLFLVLPSENQRLSYAQRKKRRLKSGEIESKEFKFRVSIWGLLRLMNGVLMVVFILGSAPGSISDALHEYPVTSFFFALVVGHMFLSCFSQKLTVRDGEIVERFAFKTERISCDDLKEIRYRNGLHGHASIIVVLQNTIEIPVSASWGNLAGC